MRDITCEPGTEVSGAAMSGIIQSITSDDFAPIIKEYGYDRINLEQWYPLQDYLNFLRDVFRRPNSMPNFVSIGMSVAQHAHMPPRLENITFAQMVEGWDAHYQANFRNGFVGQKTTVKVTDKHYKVINEQTVIPDNLEYGVLYGFAKRFLPPGTKFTVWYDEEAPRMDEGGTQTIIHVRWE